MINSKHVSKSGVALSPRQRATTLLVLGLPGTGKTYGLVSWALSDIAAGRGLCFIDPHHDAFDLLLRHTALLVQENPALAERVAIVRPLDPAWAVGINPLEMFADGNFPSERLAWFFTELVVHILNVDTSQAPRMVWLLVHTTLALAELGLTLVELPVFLRDHEWRTQVVSTHVKNPEVRQYFLKEFPKTEGGRLQWTQPLLNKLGKFTLDRDFRMILGQRRSTIHFRRFMDEQLIVLVDIPKGLLGKENTRLFGTLLAGLFQQAALSRADSAYRPQYFIYVDEWHNFITEHIQETLSESRKYGLSLVLANQYLNQLPLAQRHAVMKTAGTLVSFRIGYQEAKAIAREMWLPQASKIGWRFRWLGQMPLLLPTRERHSLDDSWGDRANEITTLKQREFWVKRRGPNQPVKQRTFQVTDPDCPPDVLEALVSRSGTRFARRKDDVRRELEHERPHLLAELAGGKSPEVDLESSIWSE